MSVIKFLFKISFMFILPLVANAQMWTTKNNWNESWEKQYEFWILNDVKDNIFITGNIATDCADAVIALRLIFSREHQLPFYFNLSDGKVATNLSKTEFGTSDLSLKWFDDIRFKKFLKDVLTKSSSKTLLHNSYSVGINNKSLRAGAFFIHDYENSRHVEIVSKVDWSGRSQVLTMMSSTVPAEVRTLRTYPFYYSTYPNINKSGFMKFKWAYETNDQQKIVQLDKMPDYSNEQYEMKSNYKSFDAAISFKILGYEIKNDVKIHELFEALLLKINQRVLLVNQGYEACRVSKCAEGSDRYYDYSTPSRDGSIGYTVLLIDQIINSEIADGSYEAVSAIYQTYLSMDVKISNNQSLRLYDILSLWKSGQYSSNPNDSIQKRWGQQ